MKLHKLDRSSKRDASFSVVNNKYPYFLKVWHYHKELELVHILKSSGTHFIGDNIEKYKEGDLVLIGEDLPHMWLSNDEHFKESSSLIADATAVHFNENFLGNNFLQISEMCHLHKLIKKAKYGIKFYDDVEQVTNKLYDMYSKEGFERVLLFLEVLDLLTKHKSYKLLASEGYVNSTHKSEKKHLNKVYEFVFENFKQPISMHMAAEIEHMNPSSFSRLFKRINRKTFTRYINEIRIGYACQLLTESKLNVTTICFESGFNNVSNFNRHFRSIMKMSPSEYLSNYSSLS